MERFAEPAALVVFVDDDTMGERDWPLQGCFQHPQEEFIERPFFQRRLAGDCRAAMNSDSADALHPRGRTKAPSGGG
jgi:hypothetical protein